jgi:hypothetical protein
MSELVKKVDKLSGSIDTVLPPEIRATL